MPQSIYWAIVTVTTLGFGDLYPITPLGKGILFVPTGIVTLELQRASNAPRSTRECPGRGSASDDADASYCK